MNRPLSAFRASILALVLCGACGSNPGTPPRDASDAASRDTAVGDLRTMPLSETGAVSDTASPAQRDASTVDTIGAEASLSDARGADQIAPTDGTSVSEDATYAADAAPDQRPVDIEVGAEAPVAGDVLSDAGPWRSSGIAILSSNSTLTTLSIADRDGLAIVRDGCVHSGSADVQLVKPLSGDVAFPSAPQSGGEVVLLDRGNGTITWVNGSTCAVLRQLSVGGFHPRPTDLIAGLPGGKTYVIRSNMNPTDPGEGGDVLIIDSQTQAVRGRIDLRAHASLTNAPQAPLLPMPQRALVAKGKVFVVLGNSSADGQTGGVGRIVAIDPMTDTVTSAVDVSGLKGCSTIAPYDPKRGQVRSHL